MKKDSILILGAGSWGTALALVLSRNGHHTYLWDKWSEHIEACAEQRCNQRHLPGHYFPDSLSVVTELTTLPEQVTDIIVAVPCEGLREVFTAVKQIGHSTFNICLASKGLEPNTLALNHEIASECLGEVSVAVLSGPSFAQEVAAGLPTAVTLAAEKTETSTYFAELFHCEVFRVYTHDDIIGVQIGGAIKNVMAIAAGIADGLGFGANTRAALITRGLTEIMRLGLAMGGKQETFMGLAGLGDLVLTCTDDQSRNRRFGLALAKGKTPEQAQQEIDQTVEGLRTAKVVRQLAEKYQIEMPISEQVYDVINGKISPRDAVQVLLGREPKSELS